MDARFTRRSAIESVLATTAVAVCPLLFADDNRPVTKFAGLAKYEDHDGGDSDLNR
jgi:hypothetical protein